MIRFERVTFHYPGEPEPALRDIDLDIHEGELVVVVGPTGSGKSTLLRAVCGLVPHFSGGTLEGMVCVGDRDTQHFPPRELADVVGFVGQHPAASFVADQVEDELAYTMENLGLRPEVMRRRVEEVLDQMGIVELRDRSVSSLSSGQQQRVAIGAVLTASPRVLVLDEPTSSLDPAGAEDVLAALHRLVHDVGMTVVIAEHRLERVIHLADRVLTLVGGTATIDTPPRAMTTSVVAPPIVRLGRLAGWSPLPLSIRDARRMAGPLRERLAASQPPATPSSTRSGEAPTVVIRSATVRYGRTTALDGVDLDITAGEIVAVMGRNGAGKSTLLAALVGLRRPDSGSVEVGGADPEQLDGLERIRRVGLVPHDPGALLYADSVDDELALADVEGRLTPGTTAATLSRLGVRLPGRSHPRSLSEGQRLLLALAVVMAHEPGVLLLDEPTRGLDYSVKSQLSRLLVEAAAAGRTVVMATHDVELAATTAHRVVVLADGEIITDGPAREVVCHSPTYSPQVARILAPAEWLSVDEVAAALAGAAKSS
jgi:energy-coupling factor transport system ATP-binding protein